MAAATIRNFEMEKLPLVILIAKLRGNLEIFQVTDFLYVDPEPDFSCADYPDSKAVQKQYNTVSEGLHLRAIFPGVDHGTLTGTCILVTCEMVLCGPGRP